MRYVAIVQINMENNEPGGGEKQTFAVKTSRMDDLKFKGMRKVQNAGRPGWAFKMFLDLQDVQPDSADLTTTPAGGSDINNAVYGGPGGSVETYGGVAGAVNGCEDGGINGTPPVCKTSVSRDLCGKWTDYVEIVDRPRVHTDGMRSVMVRKLQETLETLQTLDRCDGLVLSLTEKLRHSGLMTAISVLLDHSTRDVIILCDVVDRESAIGVINGQKWLKRVEIDSIWWPNAWKMVV